MQAAIDSGLKQTSDAPLRGFVEASAGASTLAGPFARLEGGVKLLPRLELFGFGQWRPVESTAGGGIRWEF